MQSLLWISDIFAHSILNLSSFDKASFATCMHARDQIVSDYENSTRVSVEEKRKLLQIDYVQNISSDIYKYSLIKIIEIYLEGKLQNRKFTQSIEEHFVKNKSSFVKILEEGSLKIDILCPNDICVNLSNAVIINMITEDEYSIDQLYEDNVINSIKGRSEEYKMLLEVNNVDSIYRFFEDLNLENSWSTVFTRIKNLQTKLFNQPSKFVDVNIKELRELFVTKNDEVIEGRLSGNMHYNQVFESIKEIVDIRNSFKLIYISDRRIYRYSYLVYGYKNEIDAQKLSKYVFKEVTRCLDINFLKKSEKKLIVENLFPLLLDYANSVMKYMKWSMDENEEYLKSYVEIFAAKTLLIKRFDLFYRSLNKNTDKVKSKMIVKGSDDNKTQNQIAMQTLFISDDHEKYILALNKIKPPLIDKEFNFIGKAKGDKGIIASWIYTLKNEEGKIYRNLNRQQIAAQMNMVINNLKLGKDGKVFDLHSVNFTEEIKRELLSLCGINT